MRAFYYTAVIEDQEYSSIRPLIDWLDYNGYAVVTKATKEFVDQTGRRKVKGNMDIELAVDAMEIAEHIDHMVLFSGDGDFRSLVEAMQRRGVRVTVVSTVSTQPPMVADELRRQADVFLDIVELQQKIGRDPLLVVVGLLLRGSETFEPLEQLRLGHPLGRDLGIVGVYRAALCTDKRDRGRLGLVNLDIFLQGVDQLFLEIVGGNRRFGNLAERHDRILVVVAIDRNRSAG